MTASSESGNAPESQDAIEEFLIAHNMPQVASASEVAISTTLSLSSVLSILNRAEIHEVAAPGRQRASLRSEWAQFFASEKGAAIWKRALARMMSGKRPTQAEFNEHYAAIQTAGEVWQPLGGRFADSPIAVFIRCSSQGRVAIQTASGEWEVITPVLNAAGYPAVQFYVDGEQVQFCRGTDADLKPCSGVQILVHQAVADVFHVPQPETEVTHINGVPHDNRARNLRFASHAENMAAVERRFGEANHATTLSDKDVLNLCKDVENGMSAIHAAQHYGVSGGHVSDILSGKKRSSVTGRVYAETWNHRLDADQLAEAAKLLIAGQSIPAVAALMGVSDTTIQKLRVELVANGRMANKRAKSRRYRQPTPEEAAEVIRLKQAGETYASIFRSTGVTCSTAFNIIKRHGRKPGAQDGV